MVFTPSRSSSLRGMLEETFQRRDLVTLTAGSRVPMLRNHVWLVARGMVKLSSMNEQGEDVLLALAGPNEPFGEPLSNLDRNKVHLKVEDNLVSPRQNKLK